MTRPHRRRDEAGQALLLVLIFIILFSLLLVALLGDVGSNFAMTNVTREQNQLLYGADAGLEWALNIERQANSFCGTNSPTPVGNATGTAPFNFTSPYGGGSTITVTATCEPVTGLGANTIGGYAVITGINYPGHSSGSQEFAGNTSNCTSISADPIGSGSPTYAKNRNGTSNSPPQCLYYPAGMTPNTWSDAGFDPAYAPLSSTDGTLASNSTSATSSSLFAGSANYVGWTITDSAGALDSGTVVTAEDNTAHTITLSTAAIATATNDQFTVIDSVTGSSDGTVTMGNKKITSSLFATTAYVGWPITDSAGDLAANVTITAINTGTHQATVSANSTASSTTDTFSVGGTSGFLTGYSPLQSAFSLDSTDVWAVGNALATPSVNSGQEGIFWFDGEDQWNFVGTNTSGVTGTQLNGVWATDQQNVWAVGNSGTILNCGATGPNDCTGGTGEPTWVSQTNRAGRSNTSPDGALFMGSKAAVSLSLFSTGDYVGWSITDSLRQIPANTTISAVNNLTSTATMNHNASSTEATDTFTIMPPAGTNLLSITGSDSSHVWAVGQGGIIFSCTSSCTTPGAIWTAEATPTTSDLQSVFADNSGDVWAVGGMTIVYCSSVCNTTGATWNTVSGLPGGLNTLEGISGLDSSHLWVGGVGPTLLACAGATLNCTLGANWTKFAAPAGSTIKNVHSVAAADNSDIWMVGDTGGGTPTDAIIYCSTSPCNSSGSWTSQTSDQPESTLNSVTAVPAAKNTSGSWDGQVWAVGIDPTATNQTGWITYSPLTSSAQSLATISGGPVLNGQGQNYATGLTVANSHFDQFASPLSTCPPKSSPPELNLTATAYNCLDSIPISVQNVDAALPSIQTGGLAHCVTAGNCTDMGAAGKFTTRSVSGVSGCTSYTVFAPGYYKTKPSFKSGATYYFESGVYYFNTGGWGGLGADGQPPPYIIGGQPAPGDLQSEATSNPPYKQSPCWPAIQSAITAGTVDNWNPSGSWLETSPGPGYGVEWILGGGTWLDIHTLDLELFTRQAASAANALNEGAEGISIREVPPTCTGSPTLGDDGAAHPGPYCVSSASKWAPTNAGGQDQVLQIDANKHNPYVYLHGWVYMPDSDMVLFTNGHGVWTGPIDVNSLEMTYASNTSPSLQIIAGGPTTVQFEIVATAKDSATGATLTEEAVATQDITHRDSNGNAVVTVQSWRVCNGGVSDPCSG